MKKGKYQTVSIVIPVYNERATVKKVIETVAAAPSLGLDKEIIVVDDGSTDGTAEIIRGIRRRGLKKLFLTQNGGKGTALRAGFGKITGEIVIVQDADLEYNPGDYPVLLAPFLSQNVQAVFGSRELNINKHSYPAYFVGGKLVTYAARILFGGRLTDVPTGYKAVEAKLLKSLKLRCKRFEFCPELSGLLLKRRVRMVEVPIRYKPRTIEEGKKIRFRDGVEAIWTLVRVRMGL